MNKFYAGGLFTVCILSLLQDFIGKEQYIEMVQNYWVSAWISIPLALICIVCAIGIANRD